jgi:outer membrane protein assembly factor BamB
MSMTRTFTAFAALFFTFSMGGAQAGEPLVSYFRSDHGIAASSKPLPDDLNEAEALRWRVPVSSGHSTPVIAKGKIILTTFDTVDQKLATVALRAENGEQLWRRVLPVEKIEAYHRQTGNPAPCTPAFDGEHLYAFFGSYGLICYDLDGNIVWEHRMGPFQDEYGAGSSPVLSGDRIFLSQDHDVDSFVMALDRKTGKQLWKTARPDSVRSYSTPALWQQNGKEELLVAGALELASYDPTNGEKLWSVHGLARIVIPTPVPVEDTIYMASWAPGGDTSSRIAFDSWDAALRKWDKNQDRKLTRKEIEDANVLDRFYRMDLDQSGDLNEQEWNRHAEIFQRAQNAVLAIKPSAHRGELSAGDVKWRYSRGVPYVSTPLVANGILWMVKDGGLVTKLDANTGRVLQEERLPAVGGYYASPVTADGKVFFAGEQGTVTILANQPQWKIISSRTFREKIYATPLIENGRLFIRTEKALYCFERKS